MIWRILQMEVCVMRLINMFHIENMLTSIYAKLPSLHNNCLFFLAVIRYELVFI